MTRVTLAIIVDTDETRYKLKGWRSGSHETSTPKRPAKLYLLTEEKGWSHLEQWQGAIKKESSSYYRPKPDEQVLSEALERLATNYGVEPQEIILQESTEDNHLGNSLGWGYPHNVTPDVDTAVKTVSH